MQADCLPTLRHESNTSTEVFKCLFLDVGDRFGMRFDGAAAMPLAHRLLAPVSPRLLSAVAGVTQLRQQQRVVVLLLMMRPPPSWAVFRWRGWSACGVPDELCP